MKKQRQMTCDHCGGALTPANHRKKTGEKNWVVYRSCTICGTGWTDSYSWNRELTQESSPVPDTRHPGEGGMNAPG